jgi:hypothetical protein
MLVLFDQVHGICRVYINERISERGDKLLLEIFPVRKPDQLVSLASIIVYLIHIYGQTSKRDEQLLYFWFYDELEYTLRFAGSTHSSHT